MVEDNSVNAELIEAFLRVKGYAVTIYSNGQDLWAAVQQRGFDLIILDVMLGGINGFEICRRLKADSVTRLVPVILLTALDTLEHKQVGYAAGADDYVVKPVNWPEFYLKVGSLLRLKELHDEFEAMDNVLTSLVKTVESRDRYTAGHSERVAAIATCLAREMGLPGEDLALLRRAGVLHDLGKVAVDSHILNKPGALTALEFRAVAQHPTVGAEILAPMSRAQTIVPLVRNHHEKLDGSGYPDGLKGDEISLLTRILTVADIYDALTSQRPYRRAMVPMEALQVMFRDANANKIDLDITRILAEVATGRRFADEIRVVTAEAVGRV